MIEAEHLGDRIRRLRTDLNMNLSECARRAGISKAYLSQIETGQIARPAAQVLYGIASVLGTSVAALLGEPDTAGGPAVVVSETLRAFADQRGLSEQERQMLAQIRYRGRQPETEEDWQYLFESIRRAISDGK